MEQVITVLLAVGDAPAAAQLTAKALTVSVQINGLDSKQTLSQHTRLAVLYGEMGHTKEAVRHLMAARYLLHVMTGDRHSELANIFSRLGELYDQSGSYESAITCYSRGRMLCSDLLRSSLLMISMADTSFRYGFAHQAVELQKNSYRVLKELLGAEDERLTDVKLSLEKYIRTANEASKQSFSTMATQMQDQLAQIRQQLQDQELQAGGKQQQQQNGGSGAAKSTVTPFNLDDENEDFNADGAYRPGKQKKAAGNSNNNSSTGGGGKKSKGKK